jgi:hypothetical protein
VRLTHDTRLPTAGNVQQHGRIIGTTLATGISFHHSPLILILATHCQTTLLGLSLRHTHPFILFPTDELSRTANGDSFHVQLREFDVRYLRLHDEWRVRMNCRCRASSIFLKLAIRPTFECVKLRPWPSRHGDFWSLLGCSPLQMAILTH